MRIGIGYPLNVAKRRWRGALWACGGFNDRGARCRMDVWKWWREPLLDRPLACTLAGHYAARSTSAAIRAPWSRSATMRS